MTLVALAFASLVLVCTCVVLALGYVFRERWGTELAGVSTAGEGAYRQGAVRQYRLRGLPGSVGFAAGSGFLWSLLTLVGFAPAGGLLALLLADEIGGTTMGSMVSLATVLVALSGAVLGVLLIVASVLVVQRAEGAVRFARGVATYSYVHHAAVALVMAITVLVEPNMVGLLLALIPCMIGAAQASLLGNAAAVIERAPT